MEAELSFDILSLRLCESLMGRLEMVIHNYQLGAQGRGEKEQCWDPR